MRGGRHHGLPRMLVSLSAAILAALIYGAGAVLQAMGAQYASSTVEGNARFRLVARQPKYLVGLILDVIAWALAVFSLRQLPLFATQTIVASSLAVTVLLAHFVMHTALHRADLIAVAMTVMGMVLIGASADLDTANTPSTKLGFFILLGVPIMAGLSTAIGTKSPVLSAIVAGLSFASSLFCARATHFSDGFADVVRSPLAWSIVGFGAVGLIAYARALEAGHVGSVTAVMWATEIVFATMIGWLVLGDNVRPGWRSAAGLGVVLALTATISLARSQTRN
jgi:drug/metabolite transporter (DMT)-like permease